MSESIEIIKGEVEYVTFRNKENGYTVLKIAADEGSITAVGIMPELQKGEIVELTGGFTVHPSFGVQFSVSACAVSLPNGAAAILRFLSDGVIKGIGPATAKKIVKKFGAQTLEIMENEPEKLCVINGISEKRAREFAAEIKERMSLRELLAQMSAIGVPNDETLRAYKIFGNDTYQRIKENPYLLCDSEIGITFERVDEIAEAMGLTDDMPVRIAAGIEFILQHNLLNGHTCLPREKLIDVSKKYLESDSRKVDDMLAVLLEEGRLISYPTENYELIFLREYFEAEKYIAGRLSMIKGMPLPVKEVTEKEIAQTEKKLGIEYEDIQKKAIKEAFDNGVMILTGGPGTGKTTTLKGIIGLLKKRGLKVSLAAPTGRAAKRMSELCDEEAKTIHRLLEVRFGDNGKPYFAKNEREPLETDVLIVDEVSMVDTLLFASLIKAMNLGCRLILVGDTDQLPSVSSGDVLHDLIKSGHISTVRLQKVFRQAMESAIVKNAHLIVDGIIPDVEKRESDFFFLKCENPVAAERLVTSLCTERLPRSYGFDPLFDIQVLCPTKITELGTVNINQNLKRVLNPEEAEEIIIKGKTFKVGDKVMQMKNDYDILFRNSDGEIMSGIFNGEVGTVTDIIRDENTATIKFEDKTAEYDTLQMENLELAYAVTIHKSQGNEFDCVVVPLFNTPKKLRYRNLLYTAVTRAKKILIIIGQESVFNEMVKNDRRNLRFSGLSQMLGDYINE